MVDPSLCEPGGKGRSLRRSRRRRNANKAKVEPFSKPKHHDAPMTKNDLYFALDCEMVGVGPEGLDSAVARVTIVNWEKKVILDTFVKVPVPVTDYRTHVSGIQSRDIESDDAMTFEDTRRAVEHIIRGKILIGHGLDNDLRSLGLTHPWCDVRDTACYAPYMREIVIHDTSGRVQLLPRKLRDLAWEKLGILIQEDHRPHSPFEDAAAALDLYKEARVEWEAELSRMQAKEYQLVDQRKETDRYFGLSTSSPPTAQNFVQTPAVFHVPYDHMVYNLPYQPQMSSFPPLSHRPDAAVVASTEEKPSSRFWFRGKSQEVQQKPSIKEDQEFLENVPVTRPMSPRSSGIFLFRRNALPRRVQASVSIETTASTIESEFDASMKDSTFQDWHADNSLSQANYIEYTRDALHPSYEVDFPTFETIRDAPHPLRSRLPTYLSAASHEAEYGDFDNFDWDEEHLGLVEPHLSSSLEPNDLELHLADCECGLWQDPVKTTLP